MRTGFIVASMLVLGLSGCSGGATQAEGTTPADEAAVAQAPVEATAEANDTLARALGAAQAFGEALGPVLVATPEVRGFEACERAGELMNRAAALREAGVPAEVAAPDRYREAIGQLPRDATLMSTNCQGDGESLPVNFVTAVELSFYRAAIPLVVAQAGVGDSEPEAAAQAVMELLAPVAATPIDERPAAVCARAADLVTAVNRLRELGPPPALAASSRYQEEVARLAASTSMAATYCGRGVETLTGDLVISIEVGADRVWLLLHGAWPGERRAVP